MTPEELDRLSEQALGMLSGGQPQQPQMPPEQIDSLAEQALAELDTQPELQQPQLQPPQQIPEEEYGLPYIAKETLGGVEEDIRGVGEMLKGVGEAALTLPTGIASYILGVGAKLGVGGTKALYDLWKSGGREFPFATRIKEAEKVSEKIGELGTFPPTTEVAETLVRGATYPFEKGFKFLDDWGKWLGYDENERAVIRLVADVALIKGLPAVKSYLKSTIGKGKKPSIGRLKQIARETKEIPEEIRKSMELIPEEKLTEMEARPIEKPSPREFKFIPEEEVRTGGGPQKLIFKSDQPGADLDMFTITESAKPGKPGEKIQLSYFTRMKDTGEWRVISDTRHPTFADARGEVLRVQRAEVTGEAGWKRKPEAIREMEERQPPFAGGEIPKAENIHPTLTELGVPKEQWGRITEAIMKNYDPEKAPLENYIRSFVSKLPHEELRAEKKFIPERVTKPPEYEKLPEERGIAISKTEKPEARYELKAEEQKLGGLIDRAVVATKRGPESKLQGEVVKRHILKEKPYAEIAKELEIKEGHARVLLHEGLKKLRKDKEVREILRKRVQKKFMDEVDKPLSAEESKKPGQIKNFHMGLPPTEKMATTAKRIVDALQIQPQFDRAGAPKTGRAFKLYEPKRNKELEWGAFKIQELYEKDLTLKDFQEILFLAASRKKLMGLPAGRFEKLNSSVKKVVNFFEGYKEQFKKADAPVDWPANRIREIRERLESPELVGKEAGLLRNELNFLTEAGVKYVHIPRSWMEDLYVKYPKDAPRIVSEFFRERKTYDIESLANYLKEKGIITDKDLDIRRIMASYSHKAGHKLALANIIKAAKEEGMIKDAADAPKGWQGLPQKTFPTLGGKKAHPLFGDYFEKNLSGLKFMPAKMGKILGTVKMLTFYNPIILPMYDMYQAFWTGSIRSLKTPRSAWRAFKSMYTKDKHYWDFLDHGGSSTPWTPGFQSYMKRVNEMIDKNPIFKDIKKYVTNPYRLSWEAAWLGDKSVRMITYHHYLQKLKDPMKAAQYTATHHADYASVPTYSRTKWMNKLFYTPTFKVTMAFAQAKMVKSAGEYLIKAGKVPLDTKIMAKSLVGLVSGMLIRHAVLNRLGFKTDQLGLRYYKEIDTDEGKKELVLYSATPDNVIMRFLNRFKNIPLAENKLEALFKGARWELHPLWQRAIELGTNRSDEGKRIYDPLALEALKKGDPSRIANMSWDAAKYLTTRILKFTEQIPGLGASKRLETVKAMEKDMGKLAQLLNWFVIPYTRGVKERRTNFKINKLRRLFLQMHKERPPKDADEASKRVDRLRELLNNILED